MQVGVLEAKSTFGALLDWVERGEEIVITRHGKPVARLAPCAATVDPDTARAALARIRDRAREHGAVALSWDALKGNRDAGRP